MGIELVCAKYSCLAHSMCQSSSCSFPSSFSSYSTSCSRGSWRRLASLEWGGHVRTDWASNWALKTSHKTLGQMGCEQQKSQRDFVASQCVFCDRHGSPFFFPLHWAFTAVCRLSLVAAHGGYSSLECAGFSLQWLLWLQPQAVGGHTDSVIAALRL